MELTLPTFNHAPANAGAAVEKTNKRETRIDQDMVKEILHVILTRQALQSFKN